MPELSNDDANQLDLLGIFHYVLGGITLVLAFCPSLHLLMGLLMLAGEMTNDPGQQPPAFVGMLFTALPALLMLAGWTLGALMLYAGYALRKRCHLTYCQVVAGVECIQLPLGTILGVLTLIVLNRPGVRAAFAESTSAAGTG